MTTRTLTTAAVALVLGFSGAGFAAGCNDRENTESGNQGQKEPIGGKVQTATDPGATIQPTDTGQ